MPSFLTLPSAIDALLTHNERPSSTEEETLRVLLASKRTPKMALATQIEVLRALPDPLVDENVEIDTQIGQLETALAPVRRLPPEIVQEIFLWMDYSGHRDPPWYLGQICRAWRAAALGLGRLWSRIAASAKPAVFEALLARSGNAPLFISILLSTTTKEHTTAHIERLVSLCARWRMLVLSGPDPDVLFGSLRSIRGRLASLESLHIQYYSPTAVEMETDLFTGAPKLRYLRYMVRTSVGPLPWGQIKEASVAGKLHFHVRVLAQAHNLVNLRLMFNLYEDGPVPGTYAVLPSLRILHVTGGRALDALTAPTLQRLDLPAYELDSLSAFLMRSSCPLEVLSLEDDADAEVLISLPSILSALRLVPTLKVLFLVSFPWHRDPEHEPFHRVASFAELFNALTLRTRHDDDDEKFQDSLVPRLRVFALSIEQDSFTTALARNRFREMVQSRPKSSGYFPIFFGE